MRPINNRNKKIFSNVYSKTPRRCKKKKSETLNSILQINKKKQERVEISFYWHSISTSLWHSGHSNLAASSASVTNHIHTQRETNISVFVAMFCCGLEPFGLTRSIFIESLQELSNLFRVQTSTRERTPSLCTNRKSM